MDVCAQMYTYLDSWRTITLNTWSPLGDDITKKGKQSNQ